MNFASQRIFSAMNSRSLACLIVFFGLITGGLESQVVPNTSARCHAQSAVLTEIYGRGVHAYNSGKYAQAAEWLNMAINNGLKDPRAYYFRGLAAIASGRSYEAESDFQQGADLEARGGFGSSVGQSLSRVQGSTRLKLELIREKARLQFVASGQARSQARYGELGVEPAGMSAAPGAGRAIAPSRVAVPPPAPAAGNPFADDLDQDPMVESNDALEDAVANAKAETDASAAGSSTQPDAGGGDPFGGGSAPADDPFGGSSAPADDPFGGSSAPADDPFGGGGAMDSDPFGDSPF